MKIKKNGPSKSRAKSNTTIRDSSDKQSVNQDSAPTLGGVFDEFSRQSIALRCMAAKLKAKDPKCAPNCKPLPTVERLKQLFEYNPETGVFTRLISTGGSKAGSEAGSKMVGGYLEIRVDGTRFYSHRLAFKMVHGRDPQGLIDHRDGNRQNNSAENLREVTWQQNCIAGRKTTSNSGCRGVSLLKAGGYLASIGLGYQSINLGIFHSKVCAVNARKFAESVLFEGLLPEFGSAE